MNKQQKLLAHKAIDENVDHTTARQIVRYVLECEIFNQDTVSPSNKYLAEKYNWTIETTKVAISKAKKSQFITTTGYGKKRCLELNVSFLKGKMAEVFQRKIKPNIDFSDVAPIDSANTLANGLANTLANTLANGLANGSNSEKPELDSKNTKKTGDNNNNNNNNNNISAEQSSASEKSSENFSPSPSLIRKKVLIEKATAAAAQNSIVRVRDIENGINGLETTENLTCPPNFNKSEAINKMLAPYKKDGKEIKPQRHISIIGLYILAKDMEIDSKEQLESIIKRNSRAASPLKPYSFERIIKTLRFLKEKADFKWTLETVSKFIDEDLEKINMNSIGKKTPGKILGEDVNIKN